MVAKKRVVKELSASRQRVRDADRISFLQDPLVQEVITTIVARAAVTPLALGVLFDVKFPIGFGPSKNLTGPDVAPDNANFASAKAWQASAKTRAETASRSTDPKVKADESAKAGDAQREAANRYKKAKESYARAAKTEENAARKSDLQANAKEAEDNERSAHNMAADNYNVAGNNYGSLTPPDSENQAKQFGSEADERQAANDVSQRTNNSNSPC